LNGKTEQAAWLAKRVEACPPDADPWDLAHAFLSLGNLQYESDLDDVAENAFTRSIEYFQLADEKHGAVFVGSKLALINQRKGDHQKANEMMLDALEAARQSIDLYVISYCVDDAAQLAARRMVEKNLARKRDLEKIARVLGAVDHWREILSMLWTPREKSAHSQIIGTLRRRMGGGAYLHAWKEGQSLPIESVLNEAIEILEMPHPPGPQERWSSEWERISVVLSERERQVIGLVAEGLSNQEIGERLFITERTVRFHITSIFNKLGVDNRAQAVAIASRLGIL
jgi:ATP/maltotriose-dependent transcriptional regulator MalT